MRGKKKDLIRKRYFRDNSRQAELLNVYAMHCGEFHQEPMLWIPLTKDDFVEKDNELYTFDDERDGIYPRLRIVDSARLVTYAGNKFYFFIENQEKEDYGMPSRILSHESICYREQVNMLRMTYSQKGELHTMEERFSGIKKEDRLIPSISLVLYYGTEPWNGPKDLKMLLDVKELPEELRVLVGNYPMHLLEIRDIDYLEDFKTDLHETFGFIKYHKDFTQLKLFVDENQERFRNLSEDAYDFIACQTGIRKLEQLKKNYKTEEGDYNMGKAISELEKSIRREVRKEIRKESREEGRKEGREEGRIQGRKEGREEGRIQGKEEGRKEGRIQGERSNAIHNTRMLFRNGVPLELVTASILVLTKEEICQIYKEETQAV